MGVSLDGNLYWQILIKVIMKYYVEDAQLLVRLSIVILSHLWKNHKKLCILMGKQKWMAKILKNNYIKKVYNS